MRKIISCFVCVVMLICTTACDDPFIHSKRPFVQPGTAWETATGDVKFTVLTYGDPEYLGAKCQITTAEREIDLYLQDCVGYEICLYAPEHENCIAQHIHECTHMILEVWRPSYSWFSDSNFDAMALSSPTFFQMGEVLRFHRVDEEGDGSVLP